MYVVMVYDLEAERTHKALKLGRRYLTHVQNSVLEGEISEGDLKTLQNEIDDLLKPGESTIIYELSSDTLLNRTVYGERSHRGSTVSLSFRQPRGFGGLIGVDRSALV